MHADTPAIDRPDDGFPTLCGGRDKPFVSVWRDRDLVVRMDGQALQEWRFTPTDTGLALALSHDTADDPEIARLAALAALESCFSRHPASRSIALTAPDGLCRRLLRDGTALPGDGYPLTVPADRLWQQPALWLLTAGNNGYPQQHVMTDGRRHPRRAPKPDGTVYGRHIPWLDRTLTFRTIDLDRDLDRFHRWMNDPRVAHFWQEEGDLAKHRRYLEDLMADPHMLPLIGCFDGAPFGYFEVYWAKENRLGAYYDADDYDRGWHVLIGEQAVRGRAWITAWLPSLVHFMFLDDGRTQRIVGEPRADHQQQIRNLDKSGFAKIKEFDFPHKRALLVMLLRERFFGDRLWVTRTTEAGQTQDQDGISQDRRAFA